MRTMKWMAAAALVFMVLACIGCDEHCGDVVCEPAPPLLQATVSDTITIDTTFLIQRQNPTRIDTVDSTIVTRRRITTAVVTLNTTASRDTVVNDTAKTVVDTVAFATLTPVSDIYQLATLTAPPPSPWILVAQLGNRRVVQGGLQLQTVEGCCGYTVIGFYRAILPVQ